jgi:hypothetical protein
MAKLLKNKTFLKNRNFWLAILIVFLGIYTGFFKNLFVPSVSNNTARVEIDLGDSRRVFEGEIMDDMSVLDAILASSRAGEIEFSYALLNDRTDILRINSHAEDGLNEKAWNFYLNKEKIEKDEIHRIKIKPGDEILIKFE